MSSKILMPALSPTMTEGTINKWLVKIGDNVKAGDIIAEIETDKATMEVEAVDEGKITHLLEENPNIQVPVNRVIAIIDGNEGIDLIYLPRINTVDGITEEHCRAYGYRLDENGWVNFPDWQGRIFRNRPNIRWEKKVHEQITGYKTYATLPTDKPFCILHPKTIEKQVEQNRFYNEDISGIKV